MEERENLEDTLRELLSQKEYLRIREMLADMNPADIASAMDEMEDEASLRVFRILPKTMAAEVFANLELEAQQYIIQSLSDREASNIIDNMMSDDAVDLLEEMPASVVTRILANARPDTRKDINHLLKYPEDSAGSIMTVEFIDLQEYMTVEDALKKIRRVGLDSETVNICYVVDKQKILVGTVALRYLILHQPDEILSDFMNDNVISINTMTDQEEAARMFQKYDFTAMPVVDNEDRMVGIITIDDVVDIIEEETTEDMEKMAAILPSDKPYLRSGVWDTYKKRMPWLLFLMVSATFTGMIITKYEDALSAYVVLTAYIPMLMDTGGNAGSQVSVSIIRSLSLHEVEFRDIFKAVWKEIRVAFFCGLTLAGANFIKLMLLDRVPVYVGFIVGCTLIIVVLIAKLIGCILPMVTAKIGFDPAVMASPLITTIVDAISLTVYFAIASQVLGL